MAAGYVEMSVEAGTKALADAGIHYDEIEQVAVGYCYADSTAGQRAVYELGTAISPLQLNRGGVFAARAVVALVSQPLLTTSDPDCLPLSSLRFAMVLRHDPGPDRVHHQQLRHRFNRAVPGAPDGGWRPVRLHHGARL